MSLAVTNSSRLRRVARQGSLIALALATLVGWRAPIESPTVATRQQLTVYLIGTVRDSSSGRGLDGAQVSVTSDGVPGVSAVSAANGRYSVAVPITRRGASLHVT